MRKDLCLLMTILLAGASAAACTNESVGDGPATPEKDG